MRHDSRADRREPANRAREVSLGPALDARRGAEAGQRRTDGSALRCGLQLDGAVSCLGLGLSRSLCESAALGAPGAYRGGGEDREEHESGGGEKCGVEAEGDTRGRYSVRFYIVAILFVIFDVETTFLFPWVC